MASSQQVPLRYYLFIKELHFQIIKFSNLIVEDIGVEPMTLCVQGRCSSQLS
jgi:hypothetical protein